MRGARGTFCNAAIKAAERDHDMLVLSLVQMRQELRDPVGKKRIKVDLGLEFGRHGHLNLLSAGSESFGTFLVLEGAVVLKQALKTSAQFGSVCRSARESWGPCPHGITSQGEQVAQLFHRIDHRGVGQAWELGGLGSGVKRRSPPALSRKHPIMTSYPLSLINVLVVCTAVS